MKKVYFVFSLIFVVILQTYAQLGIGVKVGYSPYATIQGLDQLVVYNTPMFKNTESVSNPGLSSEDGLLGNKNASLHIQANYSISKYFQLNGELAYMQTGGKVVYRFNKEIQPNANTTYLPVSSIAQLNYVNLPIAARLVLPLDSSIMKMFVELGGYVGVLVGKHSTQPEFSYYWDGTEMKYYPKTGGTSSNTTWLANENFSALDFGLAVGIGTQIEIGPGNVELNARYMYGLADVWGGTGTAVLNNRFINVSVGYVISLSTLKGGSPTFKSQPDSSAPTNP